MTGKDFLNSLGGGKNDMLQELLGILSKTGSDYCIIGGLAVNAYVEPVVSLDIDIIVTVDKTAEVSAAARARQMKVEEFPHSLNISMQGSDLRIQLQTDPRYQDFIGNSVIKDILGYKMKVALLADVLQGKIWAYLDNTRRGSKRQKDLADISRIIEAYPDLSPALPNTIKAQLL